MIFPWTCIWIDLCILVAFVVLWQFSLENIIFNQIDSWVSVHMAVFFGNLEVGYSLSQLLQRNSFLLYTLEYYITNM